MPSCAIEILSGSTLLGAMLAVCSVLSLDSSAYDYVNFLLPVSIFFTCIWTAFRLITRDRLLIWAPITWLLLTSACYYGFGPLIYLFGTTESLLFMDAYYPVNDFQLLRTNMLNAVSLFVVLVFTFIALLAFKPMRTESAYNDETSLRNMAVVLIAIGLSVKFLYVLPSVLQLVNWDAHGWARGLSTYATLAAAPLFVLNRLKNGRFTALIAALCVIEIGSALLTFSKLEVMRTILIFLIAWFSVTGSVKFLIRGIAAIAFVYIVFLSGFITFMRAEYGLTSSGSISEVTAGYSVYSASGRDEIAERLPGVQSWWTRLSYPSAQAFAMDAYDTGAAGNTVGLAFEALIPRVLYPDKPEIVFGDQFNQLVTGSATSKSAPGIFAEAYWCGGWVLTLFVAAYVGLFLGYFTQYNYRMAASGRYIYLGVGWLGLAAALQPDSWFAATFVGAIPTAAVFHLVLFVGIEPLLRKSRNRHLRLGALNS